MPIGWNVIQFDLRVLQEHAAGVVARAQLRARRLFRLPGGTSDYRRHRSAEISVANPAGRKAKRSTIPNTAWRRIKWRFAKDKPVLTRYNLKDCELVTCIFHKTEIMPFLLERASVNGLAVDRHGRSVAAFNHLYIISRIHRAGFVAPNLGEIAPEVSPGLYDSVLVLDYKSLYPSIIRTFLIDPVGLVEGLAHPDAADSVPGFREACFSRHTYCLPALVEQMQIYQGARRRKNRAQDNKPLSQALKIIMNAFYGVLGTSACRFFDPASSITLRGHAIMQLTREQIEMQGFDVIYSDTDSTFVWLKSPHSEAEAAAIGRALAQQFQQALYSRIFRGEL